MALRLVQVNVKARDHAALGSFWADALGWSVSSEAPEVTNVEPIGFVWPDPATLCIDVVGVPDPETVKYRAHLELATSSPGHHESLVAHLKDLGATPLDAGSDSHGTRMADPEGNVVVVSEPRSLDQDRGPIAAVVVECFDPIAMARFWTSAIDWTLHDATAERIRLRSATDVGPFLEFRRASSPGRAQSRTHLDLRPYPHDDQATEVARLRKLGATEVDLGQGNVSWVVLADVEGNDFCVLAAG